MSRLQLSFACALYDRMQPLYTGEVQPDGIDLNFIAIDEPRPIFDRMSGGQEFDVAEYSSSEFVQRFANRQCAFVALPETQLAPPAVGLVELGLDRSDPGREDQQVLEAGLRHRSGLHARQRAPAFARL